MTINSLNNNQTGLSIDIDANTRTMRVYHMRDGVILNTYQVDFITV